MTRCMFYRATTVVLAPIALILFASCKEAPAEELSGSKGKACIADSVGVLELAAVVPACEPAPWVCRAKCRAGHEASCLALAYAAEKNPATAAEAVRLFQRACLLGEANACTNYAATIWANDSSEEQLACARRTFRKACSAKEPFACGMVGRLMVESTKTPQFAEARKYLEAACDEVSGFPCRVLAKHLESGKLGAYEPALVGRLLARACAAGDPDACGNPATASETFH